MRTHTEVCKEFLLALKASSPTACATCAAGRLWSAASWTSAGRKRARTRRSGLTHCAVAELAAGDVLLGYAVDPVGLQSFDLVVTLNERARNSAGALFRALLLANLFPLVVFYSFPLPLAVLVCSAA